MTTSIRHFDDREALLALLTEPGRYPVEVADDSMTDAGIFRGDTLVVQSQQHARDGDIVVVLVDNEDISVKRIRYSAPGRIKLIADSPSGEKRLLNNDRVSIQGKVIGQIRRYP